MCKDIISFPSGAKKLIFRPSLLWACKKWRLRWDCVDPQARLSLRGSQKCHVLANIYFMLLKHRWLWSNTRLTWDQEMTKYIRTCDKCLTLCKDRLWRSKQCRPWWHAAFCIVANLSTCLGVPGLYQIWISMHRSWNWGLSWSRSV